MPADNCNLHGLLTAADRATPISFHDGRYYHKADFAQAVSHWAGQFQTDPCQRYALYTENAYPFAVLLFALFHAGKEAWIAGNNRPGTAAQLQGFGCTIVGDWGKGKQVYDCLQAYENNGISLSPLDSDVTRLVLFTSGSTGEPKPITKRLRQLESEIAVLEQQWGKQLGTAEVLATVSHQHIYGLLFRILWPLAAGRCFHSTTYLNPELLVSNLHDNPGCWVASPAHLKRLDEESPWQAITKLTAIFSSGGALPDAARQQIVQQAKQHVIEIYGSTETGGIAWKDQDSPWTLLPGLSLQFKDERYRLTSPYLDSVEPYPLEDNISLQDDGRFVLNGRADRIVKIEEKRLSLTELEQRLSGTPWVAETYGLVVSDKRDKVCVALALTEQGKQALASQGRSRFLKVLRNSLQPWFEAVLIPRKWLLVDALPLTAQGKIDQQMLGSLLGMDKKKLPLVNSLTAKNGSIALGIKVPQAHELLFFPDHFPTYPILPGVVQLAWVEHFAKLFFGVGGANSPFSHLEVIKFLKIIQPGIELTLTLTWSDKTGELQFTYKADADSYSSGRMIYKADVVQAVV